MKYLYIFKKKSGEIHITPEETAYYLIYEADEKSRQEFLGRVNSDEHRKLQPDFIRAAREYRNAVMNGDKELIKAIEDNNITGLVSDIEGDYYSKISIFEKNLDKEILQKLVEISEMIKPDESSNISVPYGDRSSTLGMLRQMGI